jgi:hypothetical protein
MIRLQRKQRLSASESASQIVSRSIIFNPTLSEGKAKGGEAEAARFDALS